MCKEIIAIYSEDLIKLTNNVQEENAERLMSKLMLRLQSTELYFIVSWIQQTIFMENFYSYDVSAG
jgi:hypothetical protein